eukprot:1013387-Alexandrium_andersonii.AAC.1
MCIRDRGAACQRAVRPLALTLGHPRLSIVFAAPSWWPVGTPHLCRRADITSDENASQDPKRQPHAARSD